MTDRRVRRSTGVFLAAVVATAGLGGSLAAPSDPPRISIDRIKTRASSLTVVWRARASGRYTVWLGGTYCGGGTRLAEGHYAARAPITVKSTVLEVPGPGAWIRVCLRAGSATLSDAVRVSASALEEPLATPGARDRVALITVTALGVAAALFGGVLPIVASRRRRSTRGGTATTSRRSRADHVAEARGSDERRRTEGDSGNEDSRYTPRRQR